MTRPGWDDYYLGLAVAASTRGECRRRQVGAVIVNGYSVIATGYNGFAPGAPSCLDGACPRADSPHPAGVGYAESGFPAIHAETNAILRAGLAGTRGGVLYVTALPCEGCAMLIRAAEIKRVVVHPG